MIAGYYNPVRLVHGKGALGGIAGVLKEAGIGKVLIVTDTTITAQPFFAAIESSLEGAEMPFGIFDSCLIDARASHIQEQARRVKEDSFDGVLGIGGGSIMCTAKGISTLVPNGTEIRPLEKSANIKACAMPCVLVPTTAGSGTEVSPSTIVKDDINGGKFTFFSPLTYARTAVLDPMVLENIPRKLNGISAADALTHAVEAVLSHIATPVTDALAFGAVRTLAGSVRASINDGDEQARTDHLIGSTVANLACGHAKLGLSHRLSRPVEEACHVNHGHGVGTLMPRVTAFHGPTFAHKLPALAQAFGIDDSGSTDVLTGRIVEAIDRLYADIGFEAHFARDQVDPSKLRQLAETAVTRTTDEGPAPEKIGDDTVITAANRQTATVAEAEELLSRCLG